MAIYRDDGIYVVHVSPDNSRGKWIVDAWFRGHRGDSRVSRRVRSEEGARAVADALWGDYRAGNLVAPDPPPATLGELVERFCARDTGRGGRRLSPSTARAYRTQLAGLVAVAGEDRPVLHVTAAHVRRHVQSPPSPKSSAAYLRASRALCRWAVKRGWLAQDLTADVEVDPGPDQVRPYHLHDELAAALAECSPALRVRCGLVAATGLRGGEAVAWRWPWVLRGLGRPSVRIPGSDPVTGFVAKGKKVRSVPLSSAAQGYLEEARDRWGADGFVLHDQAEPVRHDNWSSRFNEACRRAGVTPIGLHGLRRTAAVGWIGAGLTIYEVSRLLGHASVTTTERSYADVLQGPMVDAFDRVDARAAVPALPVSRRDTAGEG